MAIELEELRLEAARRRREEQQSLERRAESFRPVFEARLETSLAGTATLFMLSCLDRAVSGLPISVDVSGALGVEGVTGWRGSGRWSLISAERPSFASGSESAIAGACSFDLGRCLDAVLRALGIHGSPAVSDKVLAALKIDEDNLASDLFAVTASLPDHTVWRIAARSRYFAETFSVSDVLGFAGAMFGVLEARGIDINARTLPELQRRIMEAGGVGRSGFSMRTILQTQLDRADPEILELVFDAGGRCQPSLDRGFDAYVMVRYVPLRILKKAVSAGMPLDPERGVSLIRALGERGMKEWLPSRARGYERWTSLDPEYEETVAYLMSVPVFFGIVSARIEQVREHASTGSEQHRGRFGRIVKEYEREAARRG